VPSCPGVSSQELKTQKEVKPNPEIAVGFLNSFKLTQKTVPKFNTQHTKWMLVGYMALRIY